ncbi:MAG: gliding motility-associated C-terminal domain-containing protein [Bacteroidales bacterium]|jgi:gliding motility-associated-like protein
MKRLLALLLSIFNFLILSATHNRAGEITYKQISDLTYQITVTTYTYTLSAADRPHLDVNWGDNTISTVYRCNGPNNMGEVLPNYYKKNVYIANHTYPGAGVYKILMQDPNRNFGVVNIPNSVNVVFSIETTLIVNPAMGMDASPVLLNPPYDKAALGYIFIHNPAAYDPDGDSLSYGLTPCTREDGKNIIGFTYPAATIYLRVDSVTGDLIWDTPADTGKYNVAMNINEWRNGKKIGIVERDMQIEVFKTKNHPPVNSPLKNLCVEAGKNVSFTVSATDPDNDSIAIRAKSGVFSLGSCNATFTGIDSALGHSSSVFSWTPCYEDVRNQPYSIVIKSEDNNPDIKLSAFSNMTIKVLGPSPALLNTLPQGKQITLTWSDYGSSAVSGFNIYRREGISSFATDSCTSGIPSSTGFVKIGYASGSSTISYADNNDLQFGRDYAYRITALFSNGTESKASNEILSTLISGIPVIKNVSVRNTDPVNGSIFLSWKKPVHLDTIPGAVGPYEYVLSRSDSVSGTVFAPIDSIFTADLNDTVYVDTLIDTKTKGYIYKISLLNKTSGNQFEIGDPAYASSDFIVLSPGDRKTRFVMELNVPWINTEYDIFRLDNTTMEFDSVGTTNQTSYIDLGLTNGTTYTYYVRSTGGYQGTDMPTNLVNLSQIASSTAVDNEPPCTPSLNVTSQCDSLYNTLSWSVTDSTCFSDVAGYKIYYELTNSGDLELLKTLNDKNTFSYKHYPGQYISGCYAISAFDAAGNESAKSALVCVDSCNFYEIPNVFTPNGDNINDVLNAKTSGLVEKVEFKLYNRSGLLIFSTDKPVIGWDGTYNGRIVSPGVYFYQCEVYTRRISGLQLSHLSGFIHVITTAGAKVPNESTK